MIDEEYTESPAMGILGVPGTFPTWAVLQSMKNQPGADALDFTRTQVNSIWYAYKDAVLNKKMETWGDNKGRETRLHVEQVTGLPRATVLFWFITVRSLIQLGKMKSYYLNFDITQAPPVTKIFNAIAEKTKDMGKGVNTVLIVTGIALLLGGTGYALSQVAKFRKKK